MRTNVFVSLPVLAMALSYGAVSGAAGFAWWQTLLLALFALGGAAELTFVGVIAAGGSPVLAVVAGLLVNSRSFPFGLAVGGFFPTDAKALPAAHLVNDETTAFARSMPNDAMRWRAFLLMGLTFLVLWPAGAVAGLGLGRAVDAELLGLDVAFPVILLCLVLSDLRVPRTAVAVGAGTGIAALTAPFVAAGLAPMLALLGLLPAALGRRTRR